MDKRIVWMTVVFLIIGFFSTVNIGTQPCSGFQCLGDSALSLFLYLMISGIALILLLLGVVGRKLGYVTLENQVSKFSMTLLALLVIGWIGIGLVFFIS